MKILVTAALPYANGPLHLGHIRSTYLPADIYSRFERLRGNEIYYVCASDEHGTPIVVSAEKEGKTPEEFAKYYHERDEKEFQQLGFSMDIFHRTSSKENREFTQHFYTRLKQEGYTYKRNVQQAFCEKCKRFLPDRFVVGTCPFCGAEKQYSDYCDVCGKAYGSGEIKNPHCITCGTKPITKGSEHVFLALSKFSDRLDKWLSENQNLQKEIVNYVRNWIKDGLQDWDITRNLNWGIPVPDEQLVFYVWFDAPIGYASSTKKLLPDRWQEFWKGDAKIVHFIGKDIIYHHFLFWPAVLTGINDGFNLPTHIPTRGYLNLEGRKFSKSKNWFVSLEDYLSEFPADYLRYYLTSVTPYSTEDADFLWKDFQTKINNELVACIGNFIHRTLVLIKKNGSKIPAPENLDERDEQLLNLIGEKKNKIEQLMEGFSFKVAQEEVYSLAAEFNKYLSEREPWKEKDRRKLGNCLYVCSRGVTSLGVLLEPFLPFSSSALFSMLGINRKFKWYDIDKELLAPGKEVGEVRILFEKVSDEKIEVQEKKLKG